MQAALVDATTVLADSTTEHSVSRSIGDDDEEDLEAEDEDVGAVDIDETAALPEIVATAPGTDTTTAAAVAADAPPHPKRQGRLITLLQSILVDSCVVASLS